MSEKLAVNGGNAVAADIKIPKWPPLHAETREKLNAAFMQGKWSFNGPVEQQFCRDFAELQDAKYGLLMVNGTVTLECALRALGIGPGDEVIVPALTWMATAMAVVYVGATPVFVDIEESTWCLDCEKVKAAISPHTKAAIPVHMHGSMVDLDELKKISAEYGLRIIEDCAHAHGSKWGGKGIGSFGDIGSFSFQEGKLLSSGEGGFCTTNDPELYERLYRLKHIGYFPGDVQGGAGSSPPENLPCHNYRGTEFMAAVLSGNLLHLSEENASRAAAAEFLRNCFKDIPAIGFQQPGRKATAQSYYGFGFNINFVELGGKRDQFIVALRAEGVPADNTFGPVYKHILWNMSPEYYKNAGCPVADRICAENTMILPHKLLLCDQVDLERIVAAIRKVALNIRESGK